MPDQAGGLGDLVRGDEVQRAELVVSLPTVPSWRRRGRPAESRSGWPRGSFLEFTGDCGADVSTVDPHDLARNIAGCPTIQKEQHRGLLSRVGDPPQRLGYVVEEALPVRGPQLVEDRCFGDSRPGAVDADAARAQDVALRMVYRMIASLDNW